MAPVEAGSKRPYPREFSIAGSLLISVGALWMGGGAVFALIMVAMGKSPRGGGGDVAILGGALALALTMMLALVGLVGVVPLRLGIALRRDSIGAPVLALLLAVAVFLIATRSLATCGPWTDPNVLGRCGPGTLALALSGVLIWLLACGFERLRRQSAPAEGPVEGSPRPSTLRDRFFPGMSVYTLVFFGGAFAYVLVDHARNPYGDSEPPVTERSDLALALEATAGDVQEGNNPPREELLRRGPRAVPAIVRALTSCPMTLRALNAGNRNVSSPMSDLCTDSRMPRVLSLLGDLGGPDAVSELRRWLRSPEADVALRDQAGYALARIGDRESLSDLAALLDMPDPPASSGGRRLDRVMQGLALLHAEGEIPHIVAKIQRIGPRNSGASDGLRALGDLDTAESWDAFRTFGRSPDAEWRRLSVQVYQDANPQPIVDLCLERLDDPDRDTQSLACTSLLRGGPRRYPALYAWVSSPCSSPMRVDLIRDAVIGRPLPALPAQAAPPRPPLRPSLVPSSLARPPQDAYGPPRWQGPSSAATRAGNPEPDASLGGAP